MKISHITDESSAVYTDFCKRLMNANGQATEISVIPPGPACRRDWSVLEFLRPNNGFCGLVLDPDPEEFGVRGLLGCRLQAIRG